jgi:Domain of unknown function (DUF6484)
MPSALRKSSPVVLLAPKTRRVRGHRAGSLVGRDERGWLVDYPGNPHGPLPARATLPLAEADAKRAAGCAALLVFEDERSDRPIIVGWIEPESAGPEGPAVSEARPAAPSKPLEALVDGRRVVVEAEDEIILRCGEASITLRRNGRVVVRGAYVETRSRGVNRIKGGTVQIN